MCMLQRNGNGVTYGGARLRRIESFKSGAANKKISHPGWDDFVIRWPPLAADAAFRFAVPDIFVGDGAPSSAVDRCTTAGSATPATGSAEPAGQI